MRQMSLVGKYDIKTICFKYDNCILDPTYLSFLLHFPLEIPGYVHFESVFFLIYFYTNCHAFVARTSPSSFFPPTLYIPIYYSSIMY